MDKCRGSQRIVINLDMDMYDNLRKLSYESRTSMSEIIRQLLDKHFTLNIMDSTSDEMINDTNETVDDIDNRRIQEQLALLGAVKSIDDITNEVIIAIDGTMSYYGRLKEELEFMDKKLSEHGGRGHFMQFKEQPIPDYVKEIALAVIENRRRYAEEANSTLQ